MSRIRHSVNVRLGYAAGSVAETAFLDAVEGLASIPGVENFELLRQIGTLTPYTFAFSMEFADQDAYDAYRVDPDHVAFGETAWAGAVVEAIEFDYVLLER